MHSKLVFLLLFVLVAVRAPAQQCLYTSDPSPTSLTQGSIFPYADFGSQGRAQVLVPAFLFENVPTLITDFSYFIGPLYNRTRYGRITIRIGQTSVSDLSTTFASNITGPMQTVLLLENHVITRGPWSGWYPVGMQQPFTFLPGSGNLLIDVLTESSLQLESTPSNLSIAYQSLYGRCMKSDSGAITLPLTGSSATNPALRFCTDRAERQLIGESCAGSGSSTPLLGLGSRPIVGTSTSIWLSDAPANAMAACVFGFETRPPFPINLASQGAPGCRQYFQEVALVLFSANAQGTGQLSLPIPNTPSLAGAAVYAQYFVLDPPANALGITSSNYGRLLVGY